MSYANPTRLRIGMHAEFEGKDFRLLGRVVMGETEDGETYYWNEFNLRADDGTYADLVYEETERGGEWKLFTLFEPEYPLTAADASSKRVGDRLNLTDTEVRVTFKGSSRVYRIEGKAPEDVEVGDTASYFNAEARGIMQVVSWTGDEVEVYNGIKLSSLQVETAFKLPKVVPTSAFRSRTRDFSSEENSGLDVFKYLFWLVIIAVVFFQINGWNFSVFPSRIAAPTPHQTAAPPPLMTGTTGTWHDTNYRLVAHAVMEVGEVNAVFERHEYELLDDNGNLSLLVCGEQPGATNWTLFTALAPYPIPTAQQAARQTVGDLIHVDGVTATVTELFQCTVRGVDNTAPTSWRNGNVYFDYQGRTSNGSLLARWNNAGVRFYRGTAVSPKEFKEAFSR